MLQVYVINAPDFIAEILVDEAKQQLVEVPRELGDGAGFCLGDLVVLALLAGWTLNPVNYQPYEPLAYVEFSQPNHSAHPQSPRTSLARQLEVFRLGFAGH